MPTNVSAERRQLLEIFGAEIIDSPGGEGSNWWCGTSCTAA